MIIPTCGHKQKSFDTVSTIAVKEYEGISRCVTYRSVCPQCLEEYECEGLILANEYEEAKWLGRAI